MTQTYEEEIMEMKSIEVEEIKHPEIQENQVDELLGDLNPRYFEETISLKKARQKVYSSHFTVSGNFNMFTPF